MSAKDFVFWLVTWFMTLSAMVLLGVLIGTLSYEAPFNPLKSASSEYRIYSSIAVGFIFSLFVGKKVQSTLKKMFGYKTGLDSEE
ncbi:hypothetical protein L4D76_00490 [Photobacterium sagamiensis]|uniref:hypothetical protein n=1 Tax=Photobacterium sagamiensis TaxID=2910241 RepID=UPI003D096F06